MTKIPSENNIYDVPLYFFHNGKNYEAYKFFGANKTEKNTYSFRVWAPNAVSVSVIGDCTVSQMKSGKQLYQTLKYMMHINTALKQKQEKYSIRLTLMQDIQNFVPVLHQKYLTAALNGQTVNGLKTRLLIQFINHLSIYMRCISAHGRKMMTALFTHIPSLHLK